MSILWLVGFVFMALGIGWYLEDRDATNKRRVDRMAKLDLKAERKRGDILSQGRRGNYR